VGKLLLLAASVFLSLLVVELSLRIAGFLDPSFYIYDHDRGVGLRPLAEGWVHQERKNYVRINSRGLRDREHALVKPSGTIRIAVLGDSYAEAFQVPLEDAFWAEMERRFQQCPNIGRRRVEVLNFGVAGYGTAQELITLRKHVWDYSPDIVVLAFTTGNDLNDNSKQLSKDLMRPYFVYRDGQLVLDRTTLDSREASLRFRLNHSALGSAWDWLRQRLRILQLVNSVVRAVASGGLARPESSAAVREDNSGGKQTPVNVLINSSDEGPRPTEPGLDGGVYDEPVNETWKEAWRVTEGLISQMHDEVKSRGARFYVVTLSSAGQVPPNAGNSEKSLRGQGLKDFFYPERRIRALGDRAGFTVLNLAPLLKDYAAKHAVHLHGFGSQMGSGHWNQTGHRAAGEMIGDWLCAESR